MHLLNIENYNPLRMKTQYSLLTILFGVYLLFPFGSTAQGKVLEGLTLESKIMKEKVAFSIYLPPGYENGTREYPVVYLLHGYTDEEIAWVQYGRMDELVDKAIEKGDLPPMIIVMPDGGVTWYVNDYKGKKPWQDMFIKEMVPYIESNYRARDKKENRAVAGLSMGGYGALHIGMRNHELFCSVGAISSGSWRDQSLMNFDQKQYDKTYGFLFGEDLKGNDRITDTWKSFSPFHLIRDIPLEKLKTVKYYLTCGDDDFLAADNSQLHIDMLDVGLPHEYRVKDGNHNWSYFSGALIETLSFVSKSFTRQ